MRLKRRDVRIAPSMRPLAAALGGCVFLCALAAGARSQEVFSLSLFRGEPIATLNLGLGSWGSGRAEETKESPLNGDVAIKVTTHGLYQGGRIDFKQPIDLAPALRNKQTYLRMMVRFNDQAASAPQDAFGGVTQIVAPFERMRFIAIMGDGKKYELVRPLDIPPSEDVDAYVPICFPITAIAKAAGKPLTGEGAKLAGLVLCGDKYQQFNIGEMGIITDDTEINVAPLEDQVAFSNDEMIFTGSAEAGTSTLRFSWDWDARDGVQLDAVGRTASHSYKKSGKYTVTLTVSDVDGLKPKQTTTLELEVAQ